MLYKFLGNTRRIIKLCNSTSKMCYWVITINGYCIACNKNIFQSCTQYSLVNISSLVCHIIFCHLVVITIASECRDTKFKPYSTAFISEESIFQAKRSYTCTGKSQPPIGTEKRILKNPILFSFKQRNNCLIV